MGKFWLIVAQRFNLNTVLNMTKAVSRKSGKKGRSEDAVRQSAKFHKRQHEHEEETSRRWMIWLIVLCFLIVAVVVFFIHAFQFTSKEKVSERKNFDQSKKVKEPKDDRARTTGSDGRIENDAGKISCSCVFNLIWCVVSMPRKYKKEGQIKN